MNDAVRPSAMDRFWLLLAALVRAVSSVAVASRLMLTRDERRRYFYWLRPLEAIARRALVLEALALPRAPHKTTARKRRAARKRTYRRETVFAAHEWRASFPLLPRPARKRRRRVILTISLPNDGYPCSRVPPRPVSAMGVARRIEALRRVIANPAPHARRLARRLVREEPHALGKKFAPLRTVPQRKAKRLLDFVQRRADAALTHYARTHALSRWDDSS